MSFTVTFIHCPTNISLIAHFYQDVYTFTKICIHNPLHKIKKMIHRISDYHTHSLFHIHSFNWVVACSPVRTHKLSHTHYQKFKIIFFPFSELSG